MTNIVNRNGVPYKISQNIIGSIDLIEKISTYITPAVFKNTYPILLKLKPKLLDHITNLIWDETEKRFPGHIDCKCTKKCKGRFKNSYMIRGYSRHKHLNPIRSENIKNDIRNQMSTYYMSLMRIVADPLISKINNLY